MRDVPEWIADYWVTDHSSPPDDLCQRVLEPRWRALVTAEWLGQTVPLSLRNSMIDVNCSIVVSAPWSHFFFPNWHDDLCSDDADQEKEDDDG